MTEFLDAEVKEVRKGLISTSLVLDIVGKQDPWFKDVQFRLPRRVNIKPGDKVEFYLGSVARSNDESFIDYYESIRVLRGKEEVISYRPNRLVERLATDLCHLFG